MTTYQRETLVAKLHEHGVTYLAPSDAVATEVIPTVDALIVAILEQSNGRLKLALIPLFLRQPELAQRVPHLVEQPDIIWPWSCKRYYMAYEMNLLTSI